MREILFRGKRIDNGEWAYGSLFQVAVSNGQTICLIYSRSYNGEGNFTSAVKMVDHVIREIEKGIKCAGMSSKYGTVCVVTPETVGQYTGLNANGKMIFEGDIVKGIFLFGEQILSVVKFSEGSFGLAWQRGNVEEFSPFTGMCNVEYEVIGNVHDNPELLK